METRPSGVATRGGRGGNTVQREQIGAEEGCSTDPSRRNVGQEPRLRNAMMGMSAMRARLWK